jgi:hypothetical protein
VKATAVKATGVKPAALQPKGRKAVTPLPKTAAKETQSGILAATQTVSRTGGASVLVLTALALAIACFGVAAIPARSIRSPALSYVVAGRHVHMTVLGIAFLATAVFALLLAKGP